MPNEIYHWGIKGQRWGFRRFQNEDGSLTPEGELRYNQGKQKLARGKAAEMYKTKKYKAKLALKQEKQKVKDAAAIAKTAKKEQAKLNAEDRIIKKKAKNMTDEELRNEVNRLAMELDYQKKSWQVERGKKGPSTLDKADAFFERPTGKIVAEVGKNVVQNVAQTALNRMIEERTSILKKTQIENAKKTGEKIQIEIDNLKAKKSKEEDNNSSDTNSTKTSNSDTKSAADFVKDAFSGTKSGGAKGKKVRHGERGIIINQDLLTKKIRSQNLLIKKKRHTLVTHLLQVETKKMHQDQQKRKDLHLIQLIQ